jgi:hypothetical protein
MQAEGLSWEGQQQQINLSSPQDNDDCDVDAGFTSDLSIVVPPPSHGICSGHSSKYRFSIVYSCGHLVSSDNMVLFSE